VDVDPLTGNMDPALAAQAAADLAGGGSAAKRWLPRRGASAKAPLKALLPVDVFGQPADMDAFGEIARRHGLVLIEDACEALGAEYKGRKAGVLGDMGVYAFYPNKQITTGEGAVIVTDDDQRAGLMRALRNQGRAPGDTWLQHTHLGYNYRLDEMSAALGRAQLGRIEELLQHRSQVAGWYAAELAGLPDVELPQLSANTTRVSWFVYVVRFTPHIDRDRVAKELGQRGVPARPYFLPIHLQPYMVERFGYQPGDFPVTEDLGQRGLALPFSGVMPQAHVRRVAAALGEALPLAQR
jgi:dTDP-4-amino-4,6-dideoxygalactose transaminase